MRLRELSAPVRRALNLTVRHVDDRDRRAPTWDGAVLHIARLKREAHVVHEIAHWMLASESLRALPNCGLGMDPDGGLPTPLAITPSAANSAEQLASFLTILLLRELEMPWLKSAIDVGWLGPEGFEHEVHVERFWINAFILAALSIDAVAPLATFEARAIKQRATATFRCRAHAWLSRAA